MRNQSCLNDLSMLSQRRETMPLAWSPYIRAVRDDATATATNKTLAPHVAAHDCVSRLGITPGAYKTIADQSISLITFGYAGLAQPLVIAVGAHVAAERMHCTHEGNRKAWSPACDLGQVMLCLV